MPYTGRLRSCGLAKESPAGTLTTPPTEFLRFIPPDSLSPKVTPLISKAIGTLPDVNIKQTLGVGEVTGQKLKFELEPENCLNIINAAFGTDTLAEVATFVVGNSNKYIDFKEDAGGAVAATLATGTFAMGTASSQAGTLCAAVKTAMQAAGTGTYTVTYSYSTKKMTIAVSGAHSAVQILWLSGTNNANAAYAVLGFTKVDTASAASVTSNSTASVAAFTHTFTRLASETLPQYTLWIDKGAKYQQIVGTMLNKFDLEMKAKELVTMDTEWVGASYDDTGAGQTPTYSSARPYPFNTVSVSVDGSPVLGYDNLKMTINNMVKADHALSGSIWPAKVYSEGFEVDISAELFFEDTTQYAKFLAGTTANFAITLTHIDDIAGAVAGTKYSIVLNVPAVVYTSANVVNPAGVIKVPFIGKGMYNAATSNSASIVVKNSKYTAA